MEPGMNADQTTTTDPAWTGDWKSEAIRLRQALVCIRDLPIPEQDNMLSANMRAIAAEAVKIHE
jgi:hypothetical protein